MVVDRVPGETIARKILRDDEFAAGRPLLAAQCGDALARIHRIAPDVGPRARRGRPGGAAPRHPRRRGRAAPGVRAGLPVARPPPPRRRRRAGHGRPRRLPQRQPRRRARRAAGRARLGAGPPRRPARGPRLAVRAGLALRGRAAGRRVRVGRRAGRGLRGHRRARSVDRAALHWWEVLGTLKWGIICVVQAPTHLTGVVRSVELAAIGRRVCEVEHDLLLLLPGGDRRSRPGGPPEAPGAAPPRPRPRRRCTTRPPPRSSSRPCASSSRAT